MTGEADEIKQIRDRQDEQGRQIIELTSGLDSLGRSVDALRENLAAGFKETKGTVDSILAGMRQVEQAQTRASATSGRLSMGQVIAGLSFVLAAVTAASSLVVYIETMRAQVTASHVQAEAELRALADAALRREMEIRHKALNRRMDDRASE